MKIHHRVPPRALSSDPITPEYQREVDRATSALERRHARAERRLAAAIRRAKRATSTARSDSAERDVERRLAELAEIERLMQPPGAGVDHRGRKSFRRIPVDKENAS